MNHKAIIISAPSGAGKSTIINYLLSKKLGLEFSVSATCRLPRGKEKNGVEYHFLTPEEFKKRIDNEEFMEYEEVYPGCYYGTLKSEIERISAKGNTVIFDVDVLGGLNLKKKLGENALAIFIAPPSVDDLRKRLIFRHTDTNEKINERVGKAAYELTYANQFDKVVVNRILDAAKTETEILIKQFLNKN